MNENRQWFIEQYPLAEFTRMLLKFVKNAKEIKKMDQQKGTSSRMALRAA